MMIFFMVFPFVVVSFLRLSSRGKFGVRSRNTAALERGVASGEFLAQPALDTVRDRMDHVIVDLVSHFTGEMRRPAGHAFTWKCGSVLDAKKRRQHRAGENCYQSFHFYLTSLHIIRHLPGR